MNQLELSRETELISYLYKEIYLKELTHEIVGTGKSKIHKASWRHVRAGV